MTGRWRQACCVVALIAVATTFDGGGDSLDAADAHFAGFTAGARRDCPVEARTGFCVHDPARGRPIYHSYGFASARDLTGNRLVCVAIGPRRGRGSAECGYRFERLCVNAWAHDPRGDDRDCHDRDGVRYAAGVFNRGSTPTTIRMHVAW